MTGRPGAPRATVARAMFTRGIVAGVALFVLAASARDLEAQRRGGGRGGGGSDWCFSPDQCPRAPYDGRFTFVRVYFETARGSLAGFRGFGGGEPPWHHDRPEAERNLSSILREVSFLNTFDGYYGGNVFALDDPEIFRYPVLWISEPGAWEPTESEVEAFRAHLLKGGFAIFDDFSGTRDWYNFETQMRRVLPDLMPVRMMGEEPIFRSFFDIDLATLRLESGRAEYWGFFEDNDPAKRQIAMINFNNDIGEFMEYSATGYYAVDLTNEAYKLGVNYIMYALTH